MLQKGPCIHSVLGTFFFFCKNVHLKGILLIFWWIITNEFDQKRGYIRLPFATDFSLFGSPAEKKKNPAVC